MQGGAQLLAGCRQVFSSHLIIVTCYSCVSREHDLLQPLNSNVNFLQMFLAKLCMNLLKVSRVQTDLMFMFQMALPCLEATNIADLFSLIRVVLRKKPFCVLQMFCSWKLSHILSQMTAKTCTVSHHNYKAATLHFSEDKSGWCLSFLLQ